MHNLRIVMKNNCFMHKELCLTITNYPKGCKFSDFFFHVRINFYIWAMYNQIPIYYL